MRDVPPVPVVAAEELEKVPEPVVACPHCGFLGVRTPLLGEGGVPGASDLMSARVCPRCRYEGLPLEFPRREDYAAFVRDLNAA